MALVFRFAATLNLAEASPGRMGATTDSQSFGQPLLATLVTGLVAGFLATLFRDLLAAVEKFRRGAR